jgi:hypothetical protein
MRSTLFWDITQRRVEILYRRFGTTYRSHLQGSRCPRRKLGLLDPWRWDPIGCPETSVHNYHSTLRNIPEQRWSQYDISCNRRQPPTDPYYRVTGLRKRRTARNMPDISNTAHGLGLQILSLSVSKLRNVVGDFSLRQQTMSSTSVTPYYKDWTELTAHGAWVWPSHRAGLQAVEKNSASFPIPGIKPSFLALSALHPGHYTHRVIRAYGLWVKMRQGNQLRWSFPYTLQNSSKIKRQEKHSTFNLNRKLPKSTYIHLFNHDVSSLEHTALQRKIFL